MIRSFHDARTAAVCQGLKPKSIGWDVARSARKTLLRLDAAATLRDLAVFRGLRLHPLEEDRAGKHGISVNDQWRICFVWLDGHAERVELTDYH